MKFRILLAALVATLTLAAKSALAQTACENDVDCYCGQVCSWPAGHICVAATTSTPGWCSNGGNDACLYVGQTCSGVSCTPAWSATSTCDATVCTVDADCACGQVCSYELNGTTNNVCVAALTGDPGRCNLASDCIYEGQSCSINTPGCLPAWSSASVCDKQSTTAASSGTSTGVAATATATGVAASSSSGTVSPAGATASGVASSSSGTVSPAAATSGSSGSTAGSSSSGSTSGGAACTNDTDCTCGELCAWDQGATHHCVAASTTEPGWCTPGSTDTCLYDGQTCATGAVHCSPAWSSTSVCDKTSTTTTGGTAGDGGTSSGGGGCSTAPGALTLLGVVLGLGLLRKRR